VPSVASPPFHCQGGSGFIETLMHPNVGSIDRWIRLILGVGILAAGIAFGSWWGLVGLVPLATAVWRWCPAYEPFGLSTLGRR
jgi:hypothetical protein